MKNFKKIKQNLLEFKNKNEQLKIFTRDIPKDSDFFFNKIINLSTRFLVLSGTTIQKKISIKLLIKKL